MILSNQQFAQVVSVLRNQPSLSSAGSEKRRASRIEVRSRIVIVPVRQGAAGEQTSVLTRDISLDGIGLLATLAMPSGQHFVALLPCGRDDTLVVLTQTMYCGVVADGMYALGCRFVKVLPKDALQKLQSPSQAAIARIRESVLQ